MDGQTDRRPSISSLRIAKIGRACRGECGGCSAYSLEPSAASGGLVTPAIWIQPERLPTANAPTTTTTAAPATSKYPDLLSLNANKPPTTIATPPAALTTRPHLLMAALHRPSQFQRYSTNTASRCYLTFRRAHSA